MKRPYVRAMKNPTRVLFVLIFIGLLFYVLPRVIRPTHFLFTASDDDLIHSASSIACPHLLARVRESSERSRENLRAELDRNYFAGVTFNQESFWGARQTFLAEILALSSKPKTTTADDRLTCLFRVYETTYPKEKRLEGLVALRARMSGEGLAALDRLLVQSSKSAPKEFDRAVSQALPSAGPAREEARARLLPLMTDLETIEKHLGSPAAVERYAGLLRALPARARFLRVQRLASADWQERSLVLENLYGENREAILAGLLASISRNVAEVGPVIEAIVPLGTPAEINVWRTYFKLVRESPTVGGAFAKAFESSAKGNDEMDLALSALKHPMCSVEGNGCAPLLASWPDSEDADEQREMEVASAIYLDREIEMRGLGAWTQVGELRPRIGTALSKRLQKWPSEKMSKAVESFCETGEVRPGPLPFMRLIIENSCRYESAKRDACLAKLQADLWIGEHRQLLYDARACRNRIGDLIERVRAARLTLESPIAEPAGP